MSETEDYDKSATPTAHKTTHQDGGTDEISVAGLSGLLGDAQTPLAHKTTHQDEGTDEISVAGLSGTLADDQHIIDSEAVSAMGTKANSNPLNHDRYADSEALAAAVQSGAITDAITKAPTHDAVYDVKIMTEGHKTRHEDGGLDEISVAGLAGVLAEPQTPIALPKFSAHKNSAAQTIDANLWTKITFGTEHYDDGSTYDAANSKWIPGKVGKAYIVVKVAWGAVADGAPLGLSIYKNGGIEKQFFDYTSTAGVLQGKPLSCDISVDLITDYFEAFAYQNALPTVDIDGDPSHSWFSGHMLV
jgi:hypothetical protein